MLGEQLNLFLSIGGFVVGILGFVSGAVFYLKGKSKKILEYKKTSTNLITQDIADIPNLKISVGDEPTSDLTSTTVQFTNAGNVSIKLSDIATIKIISSGHFFNSDDISSDHVLSDNKYLKPSVAISDNHKIKINFNYLKPRQSFSITVLHDGKIDVIGDLVSGTFREYEPKIGDIQGSASHHTNPLSVYIICGVLTATIILLSAWGILLKQNLSNLESDFNKLLDLYTEVQLSNEEQTSDVNSASQDRLSEYLYYRKLALLYEALAHSLDRESN